MKGPDGQTLDLGYVGEVIGVDTAPLLECIGKGITPVISPAARGEGRSGRAWTRRG